MHFIVYIILYPLSRFTSTFIQAFPLQDKKTVSLIECALFFDPPSFSPIQPWRDLLALLRSHYHFQFAGVFPHTSDHLIVMRTAQGASPFINLHLGLMGIRVKSERVRCIWVSTSACPGYADHLQRVICSFVAVMCRAHQHLVKHCVGNELKVSLSSGI